ncbi:MAG: 50S ribosomal protein L20 [SAR202 cluster bacterium]|nr:50S ribosomal protein L20 [SAR202 cluster bacterium]
MTRVATGIVRRRRHKKLLKQTRGHKGVRRTLYRRAHESLIHALQYSYAHRKKKKGDMRRLWTIRINAGARANDFTYSKLVHGLKLGGIEVDRKMLADLAVRDPDVFAEVVNKAKEYLEAAA